jgi:predicted permease
MGWIRRVVNVFVRRHVDHKIDRELAFHVQMRAADLERGGLDPATARRTARRLLGNPASLRDRTRDADVVPSLETLVTDARYAIRLLRKTPTFTVAAVLTLALGIGANTAMFAVLYSVVLRPLPYANADELVLLFEQHASIGRTRLAPLTFVDVRDRSTTLSMAAHGGTGFTLTGDQDAELVIGVLVLGDLFDVLGVQPAIGRAFRQGTEDENTVVLSHALWQRRLGRDPAVLGRTITANGQSYTIVGVMPEGFAYPSARYELWVPFIPRTPNPNNLPVTRSSRYLEVVARPRPGSSPAAAAAELSTIGVNLARDFPDEFGNRRIEMSSLMEETVGEVRPALRLLVVGMSLVLLMACGNVTSLQLARFTARIPEISVRHALGATSRRLLRQFLVETVVLYAAATAAGLALAAWLTQAIRQLAPADLPRANDVSLDLSILVAAGVVSLAAGLLFGLFPAWHTSRFGRHATVLRSRSDTGPTTQRFRSGIVVVQVATALCLLTGSALVVQSLSKLNSVDKGFDPAGRMVFNIFMPAARFETAGAMNAFHRAVLESVGSQPGTRSIGATTHLPLSGQDLENSVAVPAYRPIDSTDQPVAALRGVTPAYFDAMGIPLRAGRHFTPADNEHAQRVALVNEAFVRRYITTGDPLGRIVYSGGLDGTPYVVVGVVADVRHRRLDTAARPELLVPYVQLDPGFVTAFGRGLSVVVQTDTPAATAIRSLRAAIRKIDSNVPVIDPRPMEELVSDSTSALRFRTMLLTLFAGIALVLSAVGVFGVLAYAVSQRSQEIALRLALGARPAGLFGRVLAQGGRLIAAGTVLGLASSAALAHSLQGLLFEVSPSDVLAYLVAALVLASVALLAAAGPAWRATRVDPVSVLRG